MVRLKIAYWEFDFKAVCPTLDHDLLSQAHMSSNYYVSMHNCIPLDGMVIVCVLCWYECPW